HCLDKWARHSCARRYRSGRRCGSPPTTRHPCHAPTWAPTAGRAGSVGGRRDDPRGALFPPPPCLPSATPDAVPSIGLCPHPANPLQCPGTAWIGVFGRELRGADGVSDPPLL